MGALLQRDKHLKSPISWGERRGMWMTLNLLVARDCRKTPRDVTDELEEWLASVGTSARTEPPEKLCGTPTSTGISDIPRENIKKKTRQILKSSCQEVGCSFSHPHVRSRLEKLMGSNIVRLTDREYMQKLQERIYEDHLQMQRKRIKEREAEEVEREKKLILEGKLPLEEAPKELMEHPVFKISQLTKKIIEEKQAKMKQPVSVASSLYYGSEESDSGTGEVAEEMGTPIVARVTTEFEDEEALASDYMFTRDYGRIKYESPLVKQLRELETVEEMYALADEIIGPLKTVKRGQHSVTLK